MASIQKRSDGKWRARYDDPDGRERTKHFARKVDAQRFLDETTKNIQSGNYADPEHGEQTFHEFAVEWAGAQDWKATTRQDFPRVLARAERVLPKSITLAGVDQLTIKRARGELANTYARATVD